MNYVKCICAFTALIVMLPSCRTGFLYCDTASLVEPAVTVGPSKNSNLKLDYWTLASSEIYELEDEYGRLLYYLPVKLGLSYERHALLSYGSAASLIDAEDGWDSGTRTEAASPRETLAYVPLFDVPTTRLDWSAYRAPGKDTPFTKPRGYRALPWGEFPKGFKLKRAIQMSDLRARLDKIGFVPDHEIHKGTSTLSVGSKLAALPLHVLVDYPVIIIGSAFGTAYDSTLGYLMDEEKTESKDSPE